MHVYRISKCQFIDNLDGKGAYLFAGRWQHKGTAILYTASNASLAMLETLAHLDRNTVSKYCMVCIEAPDEGGISISTRELPEGWDKYPAPDILKTVGDEFIRKNKTLFLSVPSALMPEEKNILFNPEHSDFKKLKIRYVRNIEFDERIVPEKTSA